MKAIILSAYQAKIKRKAIGLPCRRKRCANIPEPLVAEIREHVKKSHESRLIIRELAILALRKEYDSIKGNPSMCWRKYPKVRNWRARQDSNL